MAELNDSKSRRTSGAGNPPLVSSHSWETTAKSMRVGAVVFEGVAIAAGAAAVRGNPVKEAAFGTILIGAWGFSWVSARIADLADFEAAQAKDAEQAAEKAAEERRQIAAREAAALADRQRIEVEQTRKFQAVVQQAERFHNERVRDGSFLREYHDPPTHEQMERAGHLA